MKHMRSRAHALFKKDESRHSKHALATKDHEEAPTLISSRDNSSEGDTSTTTAAAATTATTTTHADLWVEAYQKLQTEPESAKWVDAYEKILYRFYIEPNADNKTVHNNDESKTLAQEPSAREAQLKLIVERGLQKIEKAKGITDKYGKFMNIAKSFKSIIDVAVENVPHAALPWAVVSASLNVSLSALDYDGGTSPSNHPVLGAREASKNQQSPIRRSTRGDLLDGFVCSSHRNDSGAGQHQQPISTGERPGRA